MDDAATAVLSVDAPPLAPAAPAIDRAHLARMTLGDARLEREVLTLFDRQAGMLLARMAGAAPAVVAAFAHTVKGSARGIGAFAVAQAAEAVEDAAGACPQRLAGDIERLTAAVAEVRRDIADLLRAH